MKVVTAVVKPFKLDDVKEALKGVGIGGLTVTESRGFGRQRGHAEVYRGAEYEIDFIPKQRLEILCEDEVADEVVEAIATAAWTGQIGDGKVWVTDAEWVYRIRTGEQGAEAI